MGRRRGGVAVRLRGDPGRPGPAGGMGRARRACWRDRSRRGTAARCAIAAFGIDTGGNHTAQVYSYCRRRPRRRIFPCKGISGNRPLWPTTPIRSKSNDKLWLLGVDTGKDALYSRLAIAEPGPGFIHFPTDDAFGEAYFAHADGGAPRGPQRAGQTLRRVGAPAPSPQRGPRHLRRRAGGAAVAAAADRGPARIQPEPARRLQPPSSTRPAPSQLRGRAAARAETAGRLPRQHPRLAQTVGGSAWSRSASTVSTAC